MPLELLIVLLIFEPGIEFGAHAKGENDSGADPEWAVARISTSYKSGFSLQISLNFWEKGMKLRQNF